MGRISSSPSLLVLDLHTGKCAGGPGEASHLNTMLLL